MSITLDTIVYADASVPIIAGNESTGLTGKTLEARLRKSDGSVLDFDVGGGGITIVDAAQGDFTINFSPGDLVVGEQQPLRIKITDGSEVTVTPPVFLNVEVY